MKRARAPKRMPLLRGDQRADIVIIVPKSTWPDYPCTEGDGWLVKVVKTKGAGASAEVVVHFVRARTRDDSSVSGSGEATRCARGVGGGAAGPAGRRG